MRLTQAFTVARARVKGAVTAPQRRAAAELAGTILLGALLVLLVAVAVNRQQGEI